MDGNGGETPIFRGNDLAHHPMVGSWTFLYLTCEVFQPGLYRSITPQKILAKETPSKVPGFTSSSLAWTLG